MPPNIAPVDKNLVLSVAIQMRDNDQSVAERVLGLRSSGLKRKGSKLQDRNIRALGLHLFTLGYHLHRIIICFRVPCTERLPNSRTPKAMTRKLSAFEKK